MNPLEREMYTTNKRVSRTCQVRLLHCKNGSLMIAKPPRRTASAGPDEDTHEPTAKNSVTIDPSGKSDTKTKLEKVDGGDDKGDEKK